MDKTELKRVADSVFERYPKINRVYITSDGQAFFEEINVKNHAAKNRTGKQLDIEPFTRPEDNPAEFKNSKTLLSEINTAETVEAVEAIMETEKAGENRKTVLEAGRKKIEKLKQS